MSLDKQITRKFCATIQGNSIRTTHEYKARYVEDFDYTLLEGTTTLTEPALIEELREQHPNAFISCATTTQQNESYHGLRQVVAIDATNTYEKRKKATSKLL